jgi:hypothetical protein
MKLVSYARDTVSVFQGFVMGFALPVGSFSLPAVFVFSWLTRVAAVKARKMHKEGRDRESSEQGPFKYVPGALPPKRSPKREDSDLVTDRSVIG